MYQAHRGIEKMIISVIGSSSALPEHAVIAEDFGAEIAKCPGVEYVVCGGMGGIMEAVCKGVHKSVQLHNSSCKTIGILPGSQKDSGNKHIDIPIVTGMGFARNIVVALTGDVVVAIGGAYGTLSELGHALSEGRPVISLMSWDFDVTGERDIVTEKSDFTRVYDVATAVQEVLRYQGA